MICHLIRVPIVEEHQSWIFSSHRTHRVTEKVGYFLRFIFVFLFFTINCNVQVLSYHHNINYI